VVDGALSQVATIRGSMGALQNRFQSVVSSLTVASLSALNHLNAGHPSCSGWRCATT
jgi:flagellin-like hook-associated protein FlgL